MADSESSESEIRTVKSRGNSRKSNDKYLDKIGGLIGKRICSLGSTLSGHLSKDKDTTNTVMSLTDIRRERNKESAKNTRKRKRIYTELLENKIKELNVELGFVKEQVKLAKINQSHDLLMKIIYGFKNLNDRENVDPEEAAKERLELVRTSWMEIPERKQLIQSHIEQFVQQCQTPFSRYFCTTALSKQDFFSDKKEDLSAPAKYLKDTLQLNRSQMTEMKGLQPGLAAMGSILKAHDDQLADITKEIFSLSDTMDGLVEKLVNYLAFQTIENFYSYFRQIKLTPNIERLLLEGAGLQQPTDGSREDCSLSFYEDLTLGKRKPLDDDN